MCRTPLHAAIINNNSEAFSLLLLAGGLNLELKDCCGHTALWLALSSDTFDLDDGDSYARRLVAHGSSFNTLVNDHGEFLSFTAASSCSNVMINSIDDSIPRLCQFYTVHASIFILVSIGQRFEFCKVM